MKNILYTLALLVSFSSFGQTASEYFKSGYYKESDHYGAISDYIKAIELNPNNDEMSYINNNGQKFYFSNHHVYYNIGVHKDELKDYYGAISDYTKAIELDPNDTDSYANRGIAKEDLGDLNGACADWKKAAELGETKAAGWVANQCK